VERGNLSTGVRAGVAGVAGAAVAFGLAELAHGLDERIPSVFVALVQAVIELTPGEFVTRGIELLGAADIPVLVAGTVVCALLLSALLSNVSVRRPALALAAVGVLAAIAILAALSEPFVAPAATVATIVGALAAGTTVTALLLRAAGLRPQRTAATPPPSARRSPVVRSREALPKGGLAVGREDFLLLGGAALLAGLGAAGAGRLLSGRDARRADAPKPLELSGESTSGAPEGGVGEEAAGHQTLPPPDPEASIDAPGMPSLITPAASFYLIDTAFSSPRVDADEWRLSVKGAVAKPIELSYKDLLGMPTREADITLSCVSNEVGGGLVSNGRWTGVLLSDVLAEAGVSRDTVDRASEQLVGRSVDGWTSGFKTELALDGREALVAFGLNDSELPLKHGYPVRLVVPGLYGYVSATKWLTEIELTSWDFDAYWIQRTWSKEGPVKTQSRIDTVRSGESLRAGGIPVGGVAWAPHRGISKVEVSTDGGETWSEARLASQLDPDSWRQYLYEWDANSASGPYTIQVRATDGEGVTQTARETPPHPSGATGYHTVEVTVA
jgi:DMSO/TMAO reductase YedYZ molybdopterin-dependent catalytic subunit